MNMFDLMRLIGDDGLTVAAVHEGIEKSIASANCYAEWSVTITDGIHSIVANVDAGKSEIRINKSLAYRRFYADHVDRLTVEVTDVYVWVVASIGRHKLTWRISVVPSEDNEFSHVPSVGGA